MTEGERVLIYWLSLAIDIIKGEYPEEQWDYYSVPQMEAAIHMVKKGDIS